MHKYLKHIIFFFSVFIFGWIYTGEDICAADTDIFSEESVLYSDEKDDFIPFQFNNISTLPTQLSITSKNRTLTLRFSPISKFSFGRTQEERENLYDQVRYALSLQQFVSAKKRESGYYIYSLRKIII